MEVYTCDSVSYVICRNLAFLMLDLVTDYLVNCYNSHSRETYDIIPVTTLALSPETGELFRMDDYPERFFKWADKFINIII